MFEEVWLILSLIPRVIAPVTTGFLASDNSWVWV
jgi:hypothetical protein